MRVIVSSDRWHPVPVARVCDWRHPGMCKVILIRVRMCACVCIHPRLACAWCWRAWRGVNACQLPQLFAPYVCISWLISATIELLHRFATQLDSLEDTT